MAGTRSARERSPRLLAIARGLTRSDADAEDLVQEVLAEALLKWDTISAADDRTASVNRMLVNASTSFWRRAFQRESLIGSPDRSDDRAERDLLLKALATLRPKHRAVLVLRYYENLNDHEIAETLGMAHAAVRGHAARGLAALRKAGLLADTQV